MKQAVLREHPDASSGRFPFLKTFLLFPAFTFFDPNDPACQEILYDPKTTVPELFAIIRQWVPQVQHKIDVIGSEILKRGCHVNDRDGLTDMTLLHYACKAGAHGVGEPAGRGPLAWGAASPFRAGVDASPWAVSALCLAVLNSTCSDFNHGTALHIAASNLCLGAVKCLLEHGANPAVRNSKGQVPADVVPDPMDMTLDKAEAAMVAKELKQLLLDAVPLSCNLPKVTLPNYDNIPGNLMLTSLGLKLGERVVVDGQKVPAPRVSCYWFGIELDKPTGKHDGSVFGVRYFSCSPKHGVFAPPSRVQSSVKKVHQVTSRYTLDPPFPSPQRQEGPGAHPTCDSTGLAPGGDLTSEATGTSSLPQQFHLCPSHGPMESLFSAYVTPAPPPALSSPSISQSLGCVQLHIVPGRQGCLAPLHRWGN
uniref:CAP-Gly domain-containing protein n=1 Tax=Terrapene triunguis TaxID=2587831 RepID=A0A674ILX3_9SAUR